MIQIHHLIRMCVLLFEEKKKPFLHSEVTTRFVFFLVVFVVTFPTTPRGYIVSFSLKKQLHRVFPKRAHSCRIWAEEDKWRPLVGHAWIQLTTSISTPLLLHPTRASLTDPLVDQLAALAIKMDNTHKGSHSLYLLHFSAAIRSPNISVAVRCQTILEQRQC
jgi:hypothetical protein